MLKRSQKYAFCNRAECKEAEKNTRWNIVKLIYIDENKINSGIDKENSIKNRKNNIREDLKRKAAEEWFKTNYLDAWNI